MNISFNDLGLSAELLQTISQKGFETPTPIQVLAIPRLLSESANLIAKARTGTGKTAAFGLPLIQSLSKETKTPLALVLVPTRELALQVTTELNSLKPTLFPRILPVYGGSSISKQLQALKNGIEIVVGTPGRVIDLIDRHALHLEQIDYFILDEADEMLNMGFIDDIETIFSKANQKTRVLLFSATMPKPILEIARQFMGDYEIIEEKVATEEKPLTEQFFWTVREEDKTEVLFRLIDMTDGFYGLIFCQTKNDVDAVAKELDDRGYRSGALHGDIAQFQREKILSAFRAKKITVLVATDVAARGIDVEGISHVVNYSLPSDAATYTHRIGRTGRAGATGIAISFIRPNEQRRISYLNRHMHNLLKEKQIPSIQEVLQAKKDRIIKSLTWALTTQSDQINGTISEITESIIRHYVVHTADHDDMFLVFNNEHVKKMVAQLVQLQYHTELSPSRYKNIRPIRQEKIVGQRKNTVEIKVGLGLKDRMTKRRLAHMLSDLTGLGQESINHIKLTDRVSYAIIPEKAAQKLQNTTKTKKNMPYISIVGKESEKYDKRNSRKQREGRRQERFFMEKDGKKGGKSGSKVALYKKGALA